MSKKDLKKDDELLKKDDHLEEMDDDDEEDEDQVNKKDKSKKSDDDMDQAKKCKKSMKEEDDEDDDEEGDDEDEKDMKESVSYSEIAKSSVELMTQDMDDISEDFREKAETIFEAAIADKAKEIRESVEAELAEKYDEKVSELVEQTDDYLSYVIQEWIEENKVEVEKGLRVTLVEDFIGQFKDLLIENHIMVPDEDLDVMESVEKERESVEQENSKLTEDLLEARNQILEFEKAQVFTKLSEGLVETDKERFLDLVEGVEAKDLETFEKKAKTIKESHFTKDKKSKTTDLSEGVDKNPTSKSSSTKAYNQAFRRLNN